MAHRSRRAWLLSGLLLISLMLCCTACGRRAGGAVLAPDIQQAGGGAPGRQSAGAADSDGDGLPDLIEQRLGTDPQRIDSDGDGLTDQFEVWGWQGIPIGAEGSLAVTDPNGNGVIAALDRGDCANRALSKQATDALSQVRVRVVAPDDPNGAPPENDLDGDYIPTDYELAGFYYEIDPLTGEDWFVKWDGDYSRNYYKTDPTKWSSDGDPWSDWEEATKRNLDQRLKKPGDHPCIPAYPNIQAVLTGYSIEQARDIETTTGKRTESGWKNSVETTSSTSLEKKNEFEGEAGFTVGTEQALKFKASYNHAEDTTNTYESVVKNDTSGLSQEEWSQVTAGDTIQTARLVLNLRVINTGTLPASDARAQFNLKLGDFRINSFVLNLTGSAGFGEIKARASNWFDVSIRNDGRASEGLLPQDLFLSLPQLQSLQMGAPITIEPVGFTGQTLVSEFDPDTGRRVNLDIGSWAPYKTAISTVTARVILDLGPDPRGAGQLVNGMLPRRTEEVRVFAYDNTGSYVGSPPQITLRDAFIWGFGAKDSALGPTVTIQDPVSGQPQSAYLKDYRFGFDKATFDFVRNNQGALDNLFDLPLLPSNPTDRVYIAKAPPLIDLTQNIDQSRPRVYWATLTPYQQNRKPVYKPLKVTVDPPTFYDPPIMVFSHYEYNPLFGPVVRAYVDDPFQVREVRFKPTPSSIGEAMEISYDENDPLAGMSYVYQLPSQYLWTGFESVVAFNDKNLASDPRPITLDTGSHYDNRGQLQQGFQDSTQRGYHTSADSTTVLEDLAGNFLNSGIQPGDLVQNLTQKTQTTVASLNQNNQRRLNLSPGWAAIPGTAPSQVGELKFKVGDEYVIVPSLRQYEDLGFYTGASSSQQIGSYEYNATAGAYRFGFSNLDAPRNPPFDFEIRETWHGATPGAAGTKSLHAVNAIGIAELGPADWNTVSYSVLRKAQFQSAPIEFYNSLAGAGLGTDYSDNHVYAARLGDGRIVKFRIKYVPYAANPGEHRALTVEYKIYKGI